MTSVSLLAAELRDAWDGNSGVDDGLRWEYVAEVAIRELGPTALHWKPRTRRGDDDKYKAFIRTMPCIVCFPEVYTMPLLFQNQIELARQLPMKRSEAAHTGVRGLGQKGPVREILPLCRRHHTGSKEAHHVLGKNFFEFHNIDREEMIKQLNAGYRRVA